MKKKTTDNSQQTTATATSYEAARGVMMRLGVGEIWHTTDGQWFTSAAKAEAHAKELASAGSANGNGSADGSGSGCANGYVKYFKIKKF